MTGHPSDSLSTTDGFIELYEDLRKKAHAMMANERAWHTWQATELVHEAFARLSKAPDSEWENRRHFYGAAAEAMRRVLVEHARRRLGPKRGGRHTRVDLPDGLEVGSRLSPEQILQAEEVLAALEKADSKRALILKLVLFAGLTRATVADVMDRSPRWVTDQWRIILTWIQVNYGD